VIDIIRYVTVVHYIYSLVQSLLYLLSSISSSMAGICIERSHVHDVALGDAILSTIPGYLKVRMLSCEVLFPLSANRLILVCWMDVSSFHSWFGQVLRAAEITWRWSSVLSDQVT